MCVKLQTLNNSLGAKCQSNLFTGFTFPQHLLFYVNVVAHKFSVSLLHTYFSLLLLYTSFILFFRLVLLQYVICKVDTPNSLNMTLLYVASTSMFCNYFQRLIFYSCSFTRNSEAVRPPQVQRSSICFKGTFQYCANLVCANKL